ncbi:MAG: precorrin-6y C5,15-methyltransferase (decarboxylating) subunit CbiE [Candidatus Bathyarchaeota archaeon]|nr:precorrin-6y C5,15-methyltransferase (decarboxylating) subunit CbiE [Candidatus Bathyarchaeota archaeon]
MGKLSIIGTGPGSPEYVTPAARNAVQAAQVVLGAQKTLSLLQHDIRGETVTLTAKNVEESLKYAGESAKNGKIVAILSTGDPGFSGLLGSVLRRSIEKGIEVDVIPGVSSVQVCAARLCMCWDDIILFTFHNGVNNENKSALAEAVKAAKTVMLLPEPKAFPPCEIASYLLRMSANKEASVFLCENLTLRNEKVVETTLEAVSKQVCASLCVMVIKPPEAKRNFECDK